MIEETSLAFFVAGGTVPPGSPSYVERSADRELYDALLRGEFCYVLNSRQMGKSSLAVRTLARLTGSGVRNAFVDLTRIGGATVSPEQWYAGLLLETGRALGLRSEAAAWLREHRDVGAAQRLFSFLHEVAMTRIEGPVVLMLDEIDAVRSLGFSTDELFAGIRQLHNGRASDPLLERLTVCLLGAALPSDLIRDPRTTPFNVGRRIELRDFAPEEARPFAAALPGGEAALARALFWTGGHPFLTQSVCMALAEGGDPDRVVRERYLDARARDTDTNLADVARRLLGDGDPGVGETERADALSLYERMLKGKPVPDDEANPSAARIKMSGVARVEGGNLRPRNRIYREAFGLAWVRENMPGGELRRQRKAFWRGALRTGLVSAAVLAAVSTLAVLAANSAKTARLAQREAVRQRAAAQGQAAEAKRQSLRAEAQAGEAKRERNAANGARLAEKTTSGKLRVALAQQEKLRKEAQAQTNLARRSATDADRQRGRAEAQTRLVTQGKEALQGELYTTRIGTFQALWDKGDWDGLKALLGATSTYPKRGWDWAYWKRTATLAMEGPLAADMPLNLVAVEGGRTLLGHQRWIDAGGLHDRGFLLDAQTGKRIRTLWSSNGSIQDFVSFAVSRNGRWLLRGEGSRRIMRDLVRGTSRALALTDEAPGVTISDDGTRLVTQSSVTTQTNDPKHAWQMTVRDGLSGQARSTFAYASPIVGFLRISPDGRRALLGYRDETNRRAGVAEVDLADGRVVGTYVLPVPPEVKDMRYAPIYGCFLSGGSDVALSVPGQTAVFERGKETPRLVIETGSANETPRANALDVTPDGRWLLVLNDFHAQVWDLTTERIAYRLPAGRARFSFDGRRIYTFGNRLRAIDWQAAAPFRDVALKPGTNSLFALTDRGGVTRLDHDRSDYWSDGSNQTSVSLLDLTGAVVARLPKIGAPPPGNATPWRSDLKPVPVPKAWSKFALSVSRDGRRAAYIDDKGGLHVWTGGAAPVATIPTEFRSASSGVTVQGPEGPVKQRPITIHPTVLISPDGRLAYCGVRLGKRRQIWDLTARRKLRDWTDPASRYGIDAARWTDASDGLLTIGGGALWIEDPRTGVRREIMRPFSSNERYAVSPDGRLIATTVEDRIEVRSTKMGRELFTLPVDRKGVTLDGGGEANLVSDLRFTPDGRSLVALFWDDTLRVFTVAPYPGAGARASIWSVLGR